MKLTGGQAILYGNDFNVPYIFADMPGAKALDKEQVDRLEHLEQNAGVSKEALTSGLRGLGQLIWCAHTYTEEYDRDPDVEDMANVGWLIQEVAGLLAGLDHVQSLASQTLVQNRLIKAKAEASHLEQ